jgi:hypothetical protein
MSLGNMQETMRIRPVHDRRPDADAGHNLGRPVRDRQQRGQFSRDEFTAVTEAG